MRTRSSTDRKRQWGLLALLAALALTVGCTELVLPGSVAVVADPAGADV